METNSVLLVQVNLFHVYEIAIDRILGTTFGEVSTIAEENQTVTKLAIEDTLVLSITASRKHNFFLHEQIFFSRDLDSPRANPESQGNV
jgi:hypothetical protein